MSSGFHATLSAAVPDLSPAPLLIGLAGGLALLLFGLTQITIALKGVAGDSLKTLLARLTSNRLKAVATGALSTALLQSSTVSTVLVVGFVSAGLMSLTSALGVILGSNVGTTITAQVAAIKIADWALALVAGGFAVSMIGRRDRIRGWGSAVLGLGLVFLGMQIVSTSMSPLGDRPEFLGLMANLENPFAGAAAGALFTAVVQTSSATTVLAIVLGSQGLIPLQAGIAIVIGANVGTCITAGIAALGKSRDAQRAAGGHIAFNLAGAVIWLVLIGPLTEFASATSPSYPELTGTARMAAEVPRQLANAHTIFNVANVVLFIGLLTPIARLLHRYIPDRASPAAPRSEPLHLETEILKTPGLALAAARREVGHLGLLVLEMLQSAPPAVLSGTRQDLQELNHADEDVDALYRHLIGYLSRLAEESLSEAEGRELLALLESCNALESVADLIETNLVALGTRRIDAGVHLSATTKTVMTDLFDQVTTGLAIAVVAVVDEDVEAATRVAENKRALNQRLEEARNHQMRRLLVPQPHRRTLYAIETDMMEVIKRIEYLSRRAIRPHPAWAARPTPGDEAPPEEGSDPEAD